MALTWPRTMSRYNGCAITELSSNAVPPPIGIRAPSLAGPITPPDIFADQNLKIVLGDDNPIQTKSLLSNERRVLSDELGFAEQDLKALDETSVHAAFVEDATRRDFILRLGENP